MQLGMVGLGRMGANMTERLSAAGHDLKTFDPKVDSRTAGSLEELVQQLDAPRSVWLMVPAGIVDSVVGELAPLLEDVQAHLGRKPREVSGDAGFATEANLAALKQRRIKGYLAPGRARHGEAHAAGHRKLTKRAPSNLSEYG